MSRANQTFFYKAYIKRDDRRVMREGTIQAPYPLDALDMMVDMAAKQWKRPLLKIELFELSKDGVLVATSTVGDRINAVLAVNAVLEPDKYADMAKRRKMAVIASHPIKPDLPVKIVTSKPVEDNEYNWFQRHGSAYSARVFPVLKKYEV
jgi:hypothetical protein